METKEFAAVLSMMQHATGLSEPYNSILFDHETISAYNGNTGVILRYDTGIEGAVIADPLIKTLKNLRGNNLTVEKNSFRSMLFTPKHRLA